MYQFHFMQKCIFNRPDKVFWGKNQSPGKNIFVDFPPKWMEVLISVRLITGNDPETNPQVLPVFIHQDQFVVSNRRR